MGVSIIIWGNNTQINTDTQMGNIDELNKLSFKVIGCSYTVYNTIGAGYSEADYARALRQEFKNKDIKFAQERSTQMYYGEQLIAKKRMDFLVEDKLIIELKANKGIEKGHIAQILGYLKSDNKELGLIISFSQYGVKVKRVRNFISH